ncbi:polyketide synthase [Anabaena sp. FACHB-1237]|uniref:beta-ketoacyl [acyl carrier protein] synthase domain-containing protein n=1 Tax=Anabaena sp. FACHB-1237 TaxID=2692769 RepID=UPI00168150CB|nr:polyketide synthase [Anabaena sp. FACHB-1237]MBD2138880.1 polyketide synthase [Anabaena sp. FACHB-1237]
MEKIAIIGLSCLFPDAKNPEQFWQNLISEKDSTDDINIADLGIDPGIFYHPEKGTPEKFYFLKGGFIRNFEFDPSEYNLPESFTQSLDNTFKWSLYAAKQAIINSGYWGTSQLSKCGVILGTLGLPTKASNRLFAPIYQQNVTPAIAELLQNDDFQLAGTNHGVKTSPYNAMISGLPAAIIAKSFGLSANYLSLDAACSSSFYAIKLASHYLRSGKADLMLAGAISCTDPLFLRMLFSGIQGYPDNGISRPFDQASRGLITSEGIGMVMLKRYSDAVKDGDNILALVCGNGLSNDGKGKHFLSPNTQGQKLAYQRAYSEAQLHPQNIDYLECHATGTLLGDTTESNSVQDFFGQNKAAPLVGSTKTNVGHLLVAAGMVGITKTILSMNNGIIPPTIKITQPMGSENHVISPQNIVRTITKWPDKDIKRVALSAFGFGGTNSHIILEKGK